MQFFMVRLMILFVFRLKSKSLMGVTGLIRYYVSIHSMPVENTAKSVYIIPRLMEPVYN